MLLQDGIEKYVVVVSTRWNGKKSSIELQVELKADIIKRSSEVQLLVVPRINAVLVPVYLSLLRVVLEYYYYS